MKLRPACIRLAIGASALAAAGCGLLDAPPPQPTRVAIDTNLFQNGGFEDGGAAWSYKQQPEWSPFAIDDAVARSGQRSLRLQLLGDTGATRTHIAGALQTLTPSQFPEYLSGYYRVDEWTPNAPFQYVQFVVIVRGGDFGDGIDPHEIRFPLSGIDEDPFVLSNARFLFLSREPPELRRWVWFGYPISQAFLARWGKVPTRWDSIEFFFEVRYDGKEAGSGESTADVRFDDLYVGPEAANPNLPPDFLQDS